MDGRKRGGWQGAHQLLIANDFLPSLLFVWEKCLTRQTLPLEGKKRIYCSDMNQVADSRICFFVTWNDTGRSAALVSVKWVGLSGSCLSLRLRFFNVPLFCSAGQIWGKGLLPRFQAVQRMMTGALFCINPKIPVCWCQSQHYALLFSHLLCRFRFKMCWDYIGLLKAYLSWLFFGKQQEVSQRWQKQDD